MSMDSFDSAIILALGGVEDDPNPGAAGEVGLAHVGDQAGVVARTDLHTLPHSQPI